MVTHRPNIQTYDPKLGQDYVVDNLSTKTTFSSLEHGFYVLEAIGEMDWDIHQDILLECILKTSTIAFFTVVPWHPGAGKLRRGLLQQFSDAIEIDDSILGYFEPSSDLLSRLFAIRNECGGVSSGEWCIGGCLAMFSELKAKHSGWNLTYLLHQAKKIGCVLSLEEMQQSYFMVKPFDGLPKIIDAIVAD